MKNMNLQDTIGNDKWMAENTDKIKKLLPETWTHMHNINGPKLGFGLKLLGIDWRSEDEFGKCLLLFERMGLMLRDGLLVRRAM